MDKIRLQKFFSDCGVMSRRACEAEISAGHVTVNGVIAVLGDKIDPLTDTVLWNGKPVRPTDSGRTYIMLNKPLGYVTTMSDEKGRSCAAELVADCGKRVYPVGRLDMYSEGLLIFTDDGELTNRLTHPSHSVPKIYSVKIKGAVSEDDLKVLTSPMELDGYRLRPVKVRVIRNGERDRAGNIHSVLHFILFEGRNRQIRKMCDKAELSVMRLCRICEGDLSLGDLQSGKWRYLTDSEVNYLKSI